MTEVPVGIVCFLYFLAVPCGMQDLSSPTGIKPEPPAVEAQSLNCWTTREVPYHIFFIHSSVDRHLGCFHVLAIVNRAEVNIVVHDFLNYGFLRVYAQ